MVNVITGLPFSFKNSARESPHNAIQKLYLRLHYMQRIIIVLITLCIGRAVIAQDTTAKLVITPLTENFYLYTTYGSYENSKVPSYGMYVITTDGVILMDTPWDTTQFQPLLDSIWMRHGLKVRHCFATHFHDDRTAGLTYYKAQGIRTYTSIRTDQLSAQRGKPRAEYLLRSDTSFLIGGISFEIFYPGEGHTVDNIVAWFPKEKILYGGCLVKSTEDNTLGYLGDANKTAYAATIENLILHCPHPRYVITGHSASTDPDSLKHTLSMARKLKKKNARRKN